MSERLIRQSCHGRAGLGILCQAGNTRGDTPLAEHKSSWLSSFLIDEKVLEKDESGLYKLGTRPEAALITTEAEAQANQLGQVLGLLCGALDGEGRLILGTNDLIAITTCSRPRDVALALVAELKIILDRMN